MVCTSQKLRFNEKQLKVTKLLLFGSFWKQHQLLKKSFPFNILCYTNFFVENRGTFVHEKCFYIFRNAGLENLNGILWVYSICDSVYFCIILHKVYIRFGHPACHTSYIVNLLILNVLAVVQSFTAVVLITFPLLYNAFLNNLHTKLNYVTPLDFLLIFYLLGNYYGRDEL